jgi:hypothetical protein
MLPLVYGAPLVRPITQAEAARMREALKTIASFRNPALLQDGAQAAARLARETLDDLGLFFEADARGADGHDDLRSGQ